MTDPFDGLRSHGRRTPPSVAPVELAGARRRRRAVGWASSGLTAGAVAVAVVVTMSGGPYTAGHDTLVGSDPSASASAEPSASSLPTVSTAAPSVTPLPTSLAAGPVSVRLSFPTGTADGLYGVEHVGGSGFRVVRIDPTTLDVQRSALIPGTEGGLAVDNQAVYVTAVDSAPVRRFAPADLAPLGSWRDPIAKLAGPVVATRSGLWVADAHGLTRLVGDGLAGGDSAERSPDRILLASGYSTPDLLANDFWAVALDDKDCPTLYHGSGPGGLGSVRTPVFVPDCSLGFAAIAATSTGVLVSTPTGLEGVVSLLTPQGSGWHIAPGPVGSNDISPSVAGTRLFASYQGQLMCLGPDARTQATVAVPANGLARVVRAGARDVVVVSGTDADTVTRYAPDPACG